ncbi:MAG TPA: hypothetical protein VGR28_04400 [Candidatus Thermoplasmatota archaeon]|nr:hypothetical protein [Candidatus Thermoplasmatota archaeon]
MGKRLLAILGVMALGASSAMVGLTMAQGDWTVLGTGLAPGEGYAVQLGDSADRIKFELANMTDGALATFSVYGPDGARIGFYSLDDATHLAEIATSAKGVWTIFVYKARSSDLAVAVHGDEQAGKFLPAHVERKELTLGTISTTEAVDHVYTAVLEEEPVLAGLYLKGTARNLQTELRTDKGVVEVVNQEELSAAGSVIVDSKGERATMPQNLEAGPFTATVKAESMSGTLQLVALTLEQPDFSIFEVTDEDEAAQAEEAPHAEKHKDRHTMTAPPHPARAAAPPKPVYAECGELPAGVPVLLPLESSGMLRLSLGEVKDPAVTLFAPDDSLLAVVVLEEEGQEEMVPLGEIGDYVLYARGPGVQAALMGAEDCELTELPMAADEVATIVATGVGPTSSQATFGLELAPLEFGLRMDSPDSVALNLRATFTGPDGEAGADGRFLELGALGGMPGDPFGFFGGHERSGQSQGTVAVDAAKMLAGEWTVDLQADTMNGSIGILALHYVREVAEDDGEA